jgi:hypothetical protein
MLTKIRDNLHTLIVKARLKTNELAELTGLPAIISKHIRNNKQNNSMTATLFPTEKHIAETIGELLGYEIDYTDHKKMSKTEFNAILLFSWQECIKFNRLDSKTRDP